MPNSAADQAYHRFLGSADPSAWIDSLRTLAATASADADIVRALVVAVYARWLGWLSGKPACTDEGQRTYDALARRVLEMHRSNESMETRAGLGILLSMKEYSAAGKSYLTEQHLAVPEFALIFESSDAARTVAALQPSVTANARTVFRPVLYRYCDALLSLGALNEVNDLMSVQGLTLDGMLTDIDGRRHEQSGDWSKAAKIYGDSKWPLHEQRAAICSAIAGGATGERAKRRSSSESTVSSKREVGLRSTEIDQGELARTAAFINACRWSSFDNWQIQYELGQLAFRRRRYLEAESHFAQAAASAPRGQRYPILDLRFSNLTWLSDESSAHDLPMEPETLLAAFAALECSTDPMEGDGAESWDAAGVRLHLAEATGRKGLLEPVLDSKSTYYRGIALSRQEDAPRSIDCWLDCLTSANQLRATLNLISYCYRNELFRSGEYLVHLVETEAWDDFFSLWELGNRLQLIGDAFDRSSDAYAPFEKTANRIATRIEELSRFDFQHLLRAYSFFRDAGEHHVAEAVLTRAARFADGAEENLTIAVARRTAAQNAGQERDRQGLACVLRAEGESTSRLERLLIARELFHYGQAARARAILRELGVIDRRPTLPAIRFSHIEFIVALECAHWLGRDDLIRLAEDAVTHFEQEVAAGRLRGVVRKTSRRLFKAIFLADEVLGQSWWERLSELADSDVDAAMAATDNAPGGDMPIPAQDPAPTEWAEWQKWLIAADDRGDAERIERAMSDVVALAANATVGFNIALWETIRTRIRNCIDKSAVARPAVVDALTPVSKSTTMIDLRTQDVCDLWRRHLREGEDIAGIETFFAAEERMTEAWETERRSLSTRAIQRALFWFDWADKAAAALESVSRAVNVDHPHFAAFYATLAEDARAVRARVAARRATLAAEATGLAAVGDLVTR